MITLKEQPHAAIAQLRFLVGENRQRAKQIAEFEGLTNKVVGHHDSLMEKVPVFHVLGFGRTAESAKAMAIATAGPIDFVMAGDAVFSTRLGRGSQVAA